MHAVPSQDYAGVFVTVVIVTNRLSYFYHTILLVRNASFGQFYAKNASVRGLEPEHLSSLILRVADYRG